MKIDSRSSRFAFSRRWSPIPALLFVLSLFLTGCSVVPEAQPDLTRYYVLTAQRPKAGNPPEATSEQRWRIGLRPVEIPAFLRQRALVIRVNRNEIRLIDDARWAEPLDAGIARVLRDNLNFRPDVADVISLSALSEQPRDFDVLVRVIRCEGGRDGDVARFMARVEIISTGPTPESRASEIFNVEVPGWDGKDYGQLAQKLSEAIAGLAERIMMLAAKK